MKKTAFLFLTLCLLSGCDFVKKTFDYKEKTEVFAEALMNENYDKCIDLFALEHEMAADLNRDMLKEELKNSRSYVMNNLGTDLDYTFIKAEKSWSSHEANTQPNTTLVVMQLSSDTHFGIFKVLFDDESMKILNFNTLDIKEPIPNMTIFWLLGIVFICVPIFNIYVIRLIKKSDRKRKWLKYVAVAVFNVPAITYSAIGGLSYSLLTFQVLLGISFNYMGYTSASWTLGIPLGGLYWLWKLKGKKKNLDLIDDNSLNEKKI